MNDIEQELHVLLCKTTGLPGNFDRSAHLYLDLGVTSLKALTLLTELEEHFSINIPDEQFVQATSFDKLKTVIKDLLSVRD